MVSLVLRAWEYLRCAIDRIKWYAWAVMLGYAIPSMDRMGEPIFELAQWIIRFHIAIWMVWALCWVVHAINRLIPEPPDRIFLDVVETTHSEMRADGTLIDMSTRGEVHTEWVTRKKERSSQDDLSLKLRLVPRARWSGGGAGDSKKSHLPKVRVYGDNGPVDVNDLKSKNKIKITIPRGRSVTPITYEATEKEGPLVRMRSKIIHPTASFPRLVRVAITLESSTTLPFDQLRVELELSKRLTANLTPSVRRENQKSQGKIKRALLNALWRRDRSGFDTSEKGKSKVWWQAGSQAKLDTCLTLVADLPFGSADAARIAVKDLGHANLSFVLPHSASVYFKSCKIISKTIKIGDIFLWARYITSSGTCKLYLGRRTLVESKAAQDKCTAEEEVDGWSLI